MKTELRACLTDLRLPSIRESFENVSERAVREHYTYEQYLFELVKQEQDERSQRRIQRLRRESGLPIGKTLSTFKRERLPAKVGMQLNVLLEGAFTDRAENLLVFGNTGSGKTHLISAIGHELISQNKRVVFKKCSYLVQELLQAKEDLRLPQLMKRLSRNAAIIIDDIGYVQRDRAEMEVLFTLIADCYEKTSIMLTSNFVFSEWERIFKDPVTTSAAIDRLVHHSIILELNLSSYRLEEAEKLRDENYES